MVKKIMIPILLTVMTLMSATTTWAAINTFSVNMTSGDAKIDDYSDDLSQVTFGLTVPLNNKLEFNGEFSKGDIDGDNDTTTFKLKGDYRIYQDKTTRLDLSGGYYQRSEDFDDYKISSLTVGLDGRIRVDNKLTIYTGLSLGLLPEEEWAHGEDDVDSLYLFHLKLNYLLNPKFGISGGYFNENFKSNHQDIRYNGLTAGVFFRF